MAQQKKKIARLVLQGISILGILFGFTSLYLAFVFTFSIQRDNIFGSLIIPVYGFVLAAFLIYPSYLMLRGKSFGVIKTIAVLLAIIPFGLIGKHIETFTTLDSEKKTWSIFLVSVFVFVLVYIISVKLLERLKQAGYGPEKISETQHSTDKQ